MNILVIGNGFDLAHDLPTKYGDFLKFCNKVSKIYTLAEGRSVELYISEYLDGWKINNEIKDILKNAFINRKLNRKSVENGVYCEKFSTNNISLDEFYAYIEKNVWVGYFSNCTSYIGENWIDFESEISRVIQALDAAMKLMKKEKDVTGLSENNTNIIKKLIEGVRKEDGKSLYIQEVLLNIQNLNSLKVLLERDLNMLVRAFEIYLCEFVEKLEIKKKSPDIDKLEIDYILSFNYTHIFSQIYNVSERAKKEVTDPYDYIHGEAYISNCIETNNMVLGIDEYLGKKRKNKEIEFIAFKKYYQRIYKGTGCKYKDWLEIIKRNRDEIKDKLGEKYSKQISFKECYGKQHNLYIFGHSLDVTDKDILRDLILNDNVYTTIFYRNQEQRGQQIANLVKVIGQDELIRRTGGSTKTIEFKLQKDMVERI